MATLKRRAGTQGLKTYWLDCADSSGYSCGFLRVHTGKPGAPRQVDTRLQYLAAMVERAPELRDLLEQAADLLAETESPAASRWRLAAGDLLAAIDQHKPEA